MSNHVNLRGEKKNKAKESRRKEIIRMKTEIK